MKLDKETVKAIAIPNCCSNETGASEGNAIPHPRSRPFATMAGGRKFLCGIFDPFPWVVGSDHIDAIVGEQNEIARSYATSLTSDTLIATRLERDAGRI